MISAEIAIKKITVLDRVLLLITGLLAGYQVGFGIEGLATLPVISYTIAFGVLLVAGLLIIIMGFEILDESSVAIISTLIPLGMSLGLVAEYLTEWSSGYLVFVILGFVSVLLTRLFMPKKVGVIVLALVHAVSGMIIFLLPVTLGFMGQATRGFALVGVGGALMGVGGLLLSFLKSGRPLLSRNIILTILPGLLLTMTILFILGFSIR